MARDWTSIEVGLVLQGGGALGAYEWGAIEALFGLMDRLEKSKPTSLKVVTGVSIGAVNGACIVGANDRADGLTRLAKLWDILQISTPFDLRLDFRPFGPDFSSARDISLFGLPGFYVPRMDLWNFWRWTSLYNTKMLEGTLTDCVSFERINNTETTFVVTAVDVESGVLRRFRNQNRPPDAEADRLEESDRRVVFEPKHVMASGSLAPQFPWTSIERRKRNGELELRNYWDGGLVDNTPLGDALEAFSGGDNVYRLLIVLNLYPLKGSLPKNLFDVADRVHELSFGNRLRQDRASASRINKLLRAVEGLKKITDSEKLARDTELNRDVEEALRYKIAKTVEIDLQRSGAGQAPEDDQSGLRDFSPATIGFRREHGKKIAHDEIEKALIKDELLPAAPFAATGS
ncbi:MAG: patatin-like phospholipase family protein [Xanthobacteraceae bacterium]